MNFVSPTTTNPRGACCRAMMDVDGYAPPPVHRRLGPQRNVSRVADAEDVAGAVGGTQDSDPEADIHVSQGDRYHHASRGGRHAGTQAWVIPAHPAAGGFRSIPHAPSAMGSAGTAHGYWISRTTLIAIVLFFVLSEGVVLFVIKTKVDHESAAAAPNPPISPPADEDDAGRRGRRLPLRERDDDRLVRTGKGAMPSKRPLVKPPRLGIPADAASKRSPSPVRDSSPPATHMPYDDAADKEPQGGGNARHQHHHQHHGAPPRHHHHSAVGGGVPSGRNTTEAAPLSAAHHRHPEHGHRHGPHRPADAAKGGEKGASNKFLIDVARTGAMGNNLRPPAGLASKLSAFAIVVSNEEYLDGALVLGWSLFKQSKMVSGQLAELIVIVPDDDDAVSESSVAMLKRVGWHHVIRVPDLTKRARRSHWAGTFNKLYLLNLTQYARVAFFDVDMLMLQNPDFIFETHLPNETCIGALGNSWGPQHHNKKPYFQTGMMLLIPSADAFAWMMNEFETRLRQEYGELNGRDGTIFRKYYQGRYTNLDDSLSMHLKPEESLDGVVGFHFRGDWKPWFNRERPPDPKSTQYGHAGSKLEIEAGPAYNLWWEHYDELHLARLLPMDVEYMGRHGDDDAAGKQKARSELFSTGIVVEGLWAYPKYYDPYQHVWLMRGSHKHKSYMQWTISGQRNAENRTVLGTSVERSKPGESCESVCGAKGQLCRDDMLRFSSLNNCTFLKSVFRCAVCEKFSAVHRATQPDAEQATCRRNALVHVSRRPLCNASLPGVRRLCACAPLWQRFASSVPFDTEPWRPFVSDEDLRKEDLTDDRSPPMSHHAAHTIGLAASLSTPCDGRVPFLSKEADHSCVAYLSDWANIDFLVAIEPSLTGRVGRTLKAIAIYRDGATKALMKFPQRLFPNEPYNELASYATDRLLGTYRVPPTGLVLVPVLNVKDIFQNVSSIPVTLNAPHLGSIEDSQDPVKELEHLLERHGLPRTTDSTSASWILASVQLLLDDIHSLADSRWPDALMRLSIRAGTNEGGGDRSQGGAADASPASPDGWSSLLTLGSGLDVLTAPSRLSTAQRHPTAAPNRQGAAMLSGGGLFDPVTDVTSDANAVQVVAWLRTQVVSMAAFDFVTGNDDRSAARNSYVGGGCAALCHRSPRDRSHVISFPAFGVHFLPARWRRQVDDGMEASLASLGALVFLDQGHAFMTTEFPEGNFFSPAVLATSSYNGTGCLFPRGLSEALSRLKTPDNDRTEEEEEASTSTFSASLKQHFELLDAVVAIPSSASSPDAVQRQLGIPVSRIVTEAIGADSLASAQHRLDALHRLVNRCVARWGADRVLFV